MRDRIEVAFLAGGIAFAATICAWAAIQLYVQHGILWLAGFAALLVTFLTWIVEWGTSRP